jgi:cysteine desulfurase/selenocysteine lyase
VGAKVLVDAAQSAPHLRIDVQELDCDFLAFSGHKLLGPFGTGALWGRSDFLEEMTPFNAGGGSTEHATPRTAQYTDPPKKFEGGTDNPSGAVGMAAATDFVRDLGHRAIWDYEQRLVERGLEKLPAVKGLTLLGVMKPEERVPLFSFTLEGKDPQKVARKLGDRGIAVSAGNLNADPLLKRLGLESVVRASCYVYNTTREIDALVEALHEIA